MFDSPDDDLLITRARTGDMAAMEALYRMYETPVYNLARRILTRPEEAEEVLQETFIEVLRSLRKYRGDGRLWSWIRQVAVSKALMRVRSRAGRPERSSSDEIEACADVGTALDRFRPEIALDRIRLETALAGLSETARAVVWLHDVEGFTHEEIAAGMKKTVSFSKSQLSRAHARLRELLEGREEAVPCTRTATN